MDPLQHAQRIVVKIGSSLVADMATGAPHHAWMASVAQDLLALQHRGAELILVSSGAVALGCGPLGVARGQLRLEEKQAAAACGQIALIDAWRDCFAPHGVTVAQLLLTLDDSEHRRRYLNARRTLETLLTYRVIPIVNENDTVATGEIRVGDNDRLAARVAQMAGADLLILLSDIDGLYTADPSSDPHATLIAEVPTITPQIRAGAAPPQSAVGTGGMITKITAAEIATAAGCATIITRGTALHPIAALQAGGRHTKFLANGSPRSARKEWIAGTLQACGTVTIDAGAAAALAKGNSLLPVGVIAIDGDFERGDAIAMQTADGRVVAKGLSSYGAQDARRIMGRNSADVETLLGYKGRDALVHRDDLVMLGES